MELSVLTVAVAVGAGAAGPGGAPAASHKANFFYFFSANFSDEGSDREGNDDTCTRGLTTGALFFSQGPALLRARRRPRRPPST
jgi:hypothetical protein